MMMRWIRNDPRLMVALFVLSGMSACPANDEAATARGDEAKRAVSAADQEVLQLSAEAIARSEIVLAKATAHALADTIEAPAEVKLNPDRVAHVAPLVSGQIRSVNVSVGDQVKHEEDLAVLRSVELGEARAQQRRAKAILDAARVNFSRQARLRKEGIASERSFLEAQLRQAEAEAELDVARARLLVFGLAGGRGPDMSIRAPIAGTVIDRHATRGENVGPERNLFIIADTSRVWIVARVYEQDMPRVKVGARAYLELHAQPTRRWEGTIAFVAPVVDEVTRTLAVRVELENDDGSLRPGLFGRLKIEVGEPRPVVAVPEDAVQTLRGDAVVFVPAPGGVNRFRAQRVTLGRRSGDLIEVRAGLSEGDPLVVAGAFLLKSQLMAGEFGEEE